MDDDCTICVESNPDVGDNWLRKMWEQGLTSVQTDWAIITPKYKEISDDDKEGDPE